MEEDNLLLQVASNPQLAKKYLRLIEQPQLRIPENYEEEFRRILEQWRGEGSVISTIKGPDDFQTQVHLLALISALQSKTNEFMYHLYALSYQWKKIHRSANRFIQVTYYDKLFGLPENKRTIITSAALFPIKEGIERIENLMALGEVVKGQLSEVNWNVKETTKVMTEYLALIKFGSGVQAL